MPQVNLLPGAISEILATVTDTHNITKADRYGLLAALLDESIPSEDLSAIDRLLYSLRRGRIQMTNELSVVM
ncbi:hypothetical protein [Microcoleus sp. FACHB-672]|uniref:hypothetical protein n=1 Tax=Microcoleus sp. FACHB-672 TaxID=2692825 RepID=UPI00168420EE|nr:hypothetical protein [Microcoleus sp. FACHB-672]MBD2039089.1 hypothetical protein [Microcoleus sp. FACHB-672]